MHNSKNVTMLKNTAGPQKFNIKYPISELARPLCFLADIFRRRCKFHCGFLQGNGEL